MDVTKASMRSSKGKLAGADDDVAPRMHGETPLNFTLSEKAQRQGHVIEEILEHMFEVKNHMTAFEEYIEAQKNENMALYQWPRYTRYGVVSDAVTGLDEATGRLEPICLPQKDVKACLRKATQFSLCVSKAAVVAMGVVGDKFDTCIDDIENSELSAEAKANAKALVTSELNKLVKHCTRTTGRVYAALDRLRESLSNDAAGPDLDIAGIKKLISHSEDRLTASHKSWAWIVVVFIMGAVASAITGLAAAHLYGPAGFDLVLKSGAHGNSIYTQVLNLVQRTQAVTDLTGEIYSIELQKINQRYKELEAISLAHGLRIDNLVESLGPTNEEGTYYSSKPNPSQDGLGSDYHRIRKASDNSNRDLLRLQQDLELMRKNINRMDIRLTKRLDRISRG
ncbi:hypothetical protein BKA66DRAFT_564390 [Pyrenochaeta sp. MPI-SDFR-AT-0127]|nr:hypothetical protein BKA66DRAFT_564390 [Pyrenochaeta sp. MPI-SDFR-AT-0127]